MNKKINIVLFLFCLISLIRTTIIIINDKNFYLEEQKSIVGVITNITKDDDKVVIDEMEFFLPQQIIPFLIFLITENIFYLKT